MGQYGRQESKTGRKAVAMEWNSIPAGLPLSSDGIWPAPTNQEEDALTRVHPDCMQQQTAATPHYWRALRSCNLVSVSTKPAFLRTVRRLLLEHGGIQRGALAYAYVATVSHSHTGYLVALL